MVQKKEMINDLKSLRNEENLNSLNFLYHKILE